MKNIQKPAAFAKQAGSLLIKQLFYVHGVGLCRRKIAAAGLFMIL